MEKISHILPASRRVTTVDTESSQPVRPGAPAFGRPSESLDVKDRVSLSAIAEGRTPEPPTYKNPKDGARAKIIEEMADRFFSAREMTGSPLPKSAETLEHLEERDTLAPPPTTPAQNRVVAEEPVLR